METIGAFSLHTIHSPPLTETSPPINFTKPRRSSPNRKLTRRSSQTIAINWSSPEPRRGTRVFYTLDNLASTNAPTAGDLLRSPTPYLTGAAPPSPPSTTRRSTVDRRLIQRSSIHGKYDHEKMVIFDIKLMVGFGCDTIPILKVPPQYPKWMEPYVQTETYDLENGGSLVFERDLYLVSERLERPPPKFHGVRIHNTPSGEQQWMITADLKGSSEPPISERILFSFKAYSWVDLLTPFRRDLLGCATRRSLRLQRAKNVATITRLRKKIRTLEVTVRTQQDQIQEMEEDGEDIQGGDDFLSDDNDFEDDEFTDEEDYEFLEAAEDGIIPIDVDEDPEE
ncbi:hypothetical protein QYE76_046925 [Lolium multiflorum]|uniref:Uncharacterized protein n=1 Tax=Lolium multiflorum TaxID=4521 RepID=A0AAD8TQS1_LOLMU|nr:hypothetical protein QYE76_046925 [Lolium multiflorum]